MKKTTSPIGRSMLVMAMILAALLGTGCSQSVTVPINLVDGFTIPNLGGIVAGQPIPDDLNIPSLPVCASMPSRAELENLLADAVGPLFAKLVHIESVSLVQTTLTATAGSLADITYFGMYWQPSPVAGVAQPQVDLGYKSDTNGLQSPLELIPSSPVDFLTLVDNESGNPEGECPSLGVTIRGRVPEPEDMPAISMQIKIKISGRIGL